MTAATQGCVFCGERPLTREHVLESWVRSGESGDSEYIREVGRATGEVSRHSRQGPQRDSVTKSVCGPCNSGWMRELGDALSVFGPRLLKGKSVRLTKAKRANLAAWAVKTIMMFQCTHGRDERFVIPPDDYHQFYMDKAPSSLMRIWAGNMEPLGKHGGPRLEFVEYHAQELDYLVGDLAAYGLGPELACKGYWVTLRLGHLVLGLLKVGSPELLAMHLLLAPRQWVAVWPASPYRDWPPPQRMQSGRLQSFPAYMQLRLPPTD